MFDGDQAAGKEGNEVRSRIKYDGSIPELAIRALFWPFGQPNLSQHVPIKPHKFGHNPDFPTKKKKNPNADTWDLLDQATNFLLADVVGSELDIQTHLADSDLMMMVMVLMMT